MPLIYALPLALLLASPFLPFRSAHVIALTACIYLLFKWVTNYRKCTASYLECKMRGVKKEQGYIYRYLNPIFDLRTNPWAYVVVLLILWGNLGGPALPLNPLAKMSSI
jgi:hypothetical protein